jgi:hypothetical protein
LNEQDLHILHEPHGLGHDQLHPADFERLLRRHATEHGFDADEEFTRLLRRHIRWHGEVDRYIASGRFSERSRFPDPG